MFSIQALRAQTWTIDPLQPTTAPNKPFAAAGSAFTHPQRPKPP